MAHLKQRNDAAQCEVVRDVSAFVAHQAVLWDDYRFLCDAACAEPGMGVGGRIQSEAIFEINSFAREKRVNSSNGIIAT